MSNVPELMFSRGAALFAAPLTLRFWIVSAVPPAAVPGKLTTTGMGPLGRISRLSVARIAPGLDQQMGLVK